MALAWKKRGPLVESLGAGDFAAFIAYLNDHLADNGGAAGYFQPMPHGQSAFPAERAAPFRSGLGIAVGAKGWRRAWVARAGEGRDRRPYRPEGASRGIHWASVPVGNGRGQGAIAGSASARR